MRYFIEFGGGLGDIFAEVMSRGAYQTLSYLASDDTVEIVLVTHNSQAHELFKWHPNRRQFTIHDHGYCICGTEKEYRAKYELTGLYGLKLPRLPQTRSASVVFYPSPDDTAILDSLPPQYIAVALGAGTTDRFIPLPLAERIISKLLESGSYVVLIGKNYDRSGRKEPVPNISHANLTNLIDRLSVPGTALMLQRAGGLFTSHSASNLLGWYFRKPQLLLYPESVVARHGMSIEHHDSWSFGVVFPETVHSRFDNYRPDMLDKFLSIIRDPEE